MAPIIQRRLEALAFLAACMAYYASQGYSFETFLLYFFIPDLTILAYFKGPKIGAYFYNTAHFYLFPVSIGLYAIYRDDSTLMQTALIWGSHIAFDRTIGWGLKHSDSFCNTDLGRRKLPLDVAIFR
jgi:hypothetical protein